MNELQFLSKFVTSTFIFYSVVLYANHKNRELELNAEKYHANLPAKLPEKLPSKDLLILNNIENIKLKTT